MKVSGEVEGSSELIPSLRWWPSTFQVSEFGASSPAINFGEDFQADRQTRWLDSGRAGRSVGQERTAGPLRENLILKPPTTAFSHGYGSVDGRRQKAAHLRQSGSPSSTLSLAPFLLLVHLNISLLSSNLSPEQALSKKRTHQKQAKAGEENRAGGVEDENGETLTPRPSWNST